MIFREERNPKILTCPRTAKIKMLTAGKKLDLLQTKINKLWIDLRKIFKGKGLKTHTLQMISVKAKTKK